MAVGKYFLYRKTLLPRGCPIVKIQALNQFVQNQPFPKENDVFCLHIAARF